MPVHNSDIASIFTELADLLDIQGANPFRVRAYRNAARVVSAHPDNLADIIARGGKIPKLPGIGADLTAKIAEIARTGRLSMLEQTMRELPAGLLELLRLPGLGPKRVRIIHDKLGIRGLGDLKRALKMGRLRALPGFGEKTEHGISEAIRRQPAHKPRTTLPIADEIASHLVAYLKQSGATSQAIAAGSIRRRLETVGDIDILVASNDPNLTMKQFIKYEETGEVIAHGRTRSSIVLRSGLQIDLRVVPTESFGAALHYFTGSKAHNIAIRKLGLQRGLKINEYGVFKGRRRIAGRTEQEVFASVKLPYIAPELREDSGEINAARDGRLPELVTLEDLRGDLHTHTVATDGHMTLEELAHAAEALGREYVAVTDHTRHLTVASGLDARRMARHIREIDRINGKLKRLRLLKSAEVDILENGSLDLPDSILAELDLTVCSIHYKFELSEKKQTERILRAMENPYFNILAHPTGRLIGTRPPYEINLERIFDAASEHGCAIELNSQPDRLDLNDTHCRMAREHGVLVVISSDAHSAADLGNLRWGIAQARRGWLEKQDVLNTRSLTSLLGVLGRKRSRAA